MSKNSGSSSNDTQKNNIITVGEFGEDQYPEGTSISKTNEVDVEQEATENITEMKR